MGFYHWVMVAVTGGVGVAATLCLCSLLIRPIRLRSCELWAPLQLPDPDLAMRGMARAKTGPVLTDPPLSCRGP